jgi:hypothetical protein
VVGWIVLGLGGGGLDLLTADDEGNLDGTFGSKRRYGGCEGVAVR